MAHDPMDDAVLGKPEQPVSAPKQRQPKKSSNPKAIDREPREVVAMEDVFDGLAFHRRGEEFVWYGPIPDGGKIAPKGTPLPDDGMAVPGAPQRRGHAPAPPWTTPGHPDIVGR